MTTRAKRSRPLHEPFEGPIALYPGSLGDFGPILGLSLKGPVKTFIFVNDHFNTSLFTQSAKLFGCTLIQHEEMSGLFFDTYFNPDDGITILHVQNCYLGRSDCVLPTKYEELFQRSTYLILIGVIFQDEFIQQLSNQIDNELTIVTDNHPWKWFGLSKEYRWVNNAPLLGQIFKNHIILSGKAQTAINEKGGKICQPRQQSVYECNQEDDIVVTEKKLKLSKALSTELGL